MASTVSTLSTMAKEAFINSRTTEQAKAVISDVARESGRTASAYLLWAAAQQDPRIAAALGMAPLPPAKSTNQQIHNR